MKLIDIAEGRDAPLYHGTQMINLLLILKEDSLDKGVHWGRPGEPDGVRLTRSLAVARSFAEDQELPGGVLALDQTKLVQRHRIVPYRDVDASGEYWSDEAEEVVISGAIQPLSQYLTGIYVSHAAIRGMIQEEDWQYAYEEQPDRFQSPEEVGMLMWNLEHHPLRVDMDMFMSRNGPR